MFAANRKRMHWMGQAKEEIPMAPVADMIILLVFYLLTRITPEAFIEVTDESAESAETAVVFQLLPDEIEIFIGQERIVREVRGGRLSHLAPTITAHASFSSDRPAIVKLHPEVKAGAIRQIFPLLRECGFPSYRVSFE